MSLALLEKSHAIPKEFGSREHIQYLGQVMKITDELRADGYRTPKEVPESVLAAKNSACSNPWHDSYQCV